MRDMKENKRKTRDQVYKGRNDGKARVQRGNPGLPRRARGEKQNQEEKRVKKTRKQDSN